MPKVIFNTLPPETLTERWKRAWRGLPPRPYQNVEISCNGHIIVAARGVPVQISDEHLEVCDYVRGPLRFLFEYKPV